MLSCLQKQITNSKNVKICLKFKIMKLKYRKIPTDYLILATEDGECVNRKKGGKWGG